MVSYLPRPFPSCFTAAGHEGVCGHGLGHPSGTEAEEGHFPAGARHQWHHQAVQQVCEAGFRAVHRANGAGGRHRGAQRSVGGAGQIHSAGLAVQAPEVVKVALNLFLPDLTTFRRRELCGAGFDRATRAQPAGKGELRYT